MKKFFALALLLLLSGPVFGQAVDSSQMKLKTNGGLTGDTASALAVGIYRATSAPSSPVTGQLWCDTTLSPCTLKQWDSSAWIAPQVNAAITTQADTSSFPGSPVDGQIFYSKTPRALWVYDSTAAAWTAIGYTSFQSGANILDTYNGTLVSTVGAATAATSGTAGSLSAGTYSYKITCRTASGGETTGGTASNTITSLVSKSADLSSIPTCSGGTTTNRNVYRTKVNLAATGPWYWVGNIADNSTTTFHDGLADSSAVGLAPDVNFSAPLPGSWTVLNVGSFTSGGCGGTGGTRGTMVCYNGANGAPGLVGTTTDGVNLRASLDISSYSTGNYTILLRYKLWGQNGDNFPTATSTAIFGMRYGTADNAQRFYMHMGQVSGSNEFTSPFSSSNRGIWFANVRATVGGTSYGNGNFQLNNPFPEMDAFPYYLKVVRRGGNLQVYHSSDSVIWTPVSSVATTANNTSLAASFNAGANSNVIGNSSLNHVEIPMATSSGSGAGAGPWVEIDSFSLTVN